MTLSLHQRIGIAIFGLLLVIAISCVEAAEAPTSTPEATPDDAANTPVSQISETGGTIWLEAPVGTYQTGWATLSMVDGHLRVEVDVAPPEPVAQPAHIHFGTCDELGGVEYSLENIVGGHSMTEIEGVTLRDVATGDRSINLHLSFSDFSIFTACGEIPALPDLPSAPEDETAN